MTTWIHTHPRARDWHRCDMCSRQIDPGETYLRGVGLDGKAWPWKECTHCQAARELYDITWDHFEYDPDCFDEWCSDVRGAGPELRAAAGYRSQWRTQSGSLWPMPKKMTA